MNSPAGRNRTLLRCVGHIDRSWETAVSPAAQIRKTSYVQQLKKQELIDAICEKLDIQRPEAKSEEPKAEAEGKPEEPEE